MARIWEVSNIYGQSNCGWSHHSLLVLAPAAAWMRCSTSLNFFIASLISRVICSCPFVCGLVFIELSEWLTLQILIIHSQTCPEFSLATDLTLSKMLTFLALCIHSDYLLTKESHIQYVGPITWVIYIRGRSSVIILTWGVCYSWEHRYKPVPWGLSAG